MNEFKVGDRYVVKEGAKRMTGFNVDYLAGEVVTVRPDRSGTLDRDGDVCVVTERGDWEWVAPHYLHKIADEPDRGGIIPERLEALRRAVQLGIKGSAAVEAARFMLGVAE